MDDYYFNSLLSRFTLVPKRARRTDGFKHRFLTFCTCRNWRLPTW